MKSILDSSFKYTPAHATDIRKSFARERARLAKEKEKQEQKVTLLRKTK